MYEDKTQDKHYFLFFLIMNSANSRAMSRGQSSFENRQRLTCLDSQGEFIPPFGCQDREEPCILKAGESIRVILEAWREHSSEWDVI